MESSRAVRRADDANIPSAKRSVKIWRPHDGVAAEAFDDHHELYERGASDRSVTRRRFWIRRGIVPHLPLNFHPAALTVSGLCSEADLWTIQN
ncbi:hypothetical protein I6F09_25070 [Bradyrhizobium sp. IC3195]|uniref:hypothetical protein n=1 Tax=Bradyrhizobium sp. IC3195 TaxID=2793804 RepID=UPI001CD3602E|nr:hypothetical protein [Bradyrhizobium sp. IC3195]MCA1471144.1 hypothetical protein [Bradyrhizobium sp. IC3195]